MDRNIFSQIKSYFFLALSLRFLFSSMLVHGWQEKLQKAQS